MDTIKNTVNSMNDMLIEITNWLMKFDNSTIDRLAKKNSPLTMTGMGKNLFEQTPAKKTVDENMDFLLGEIDKSAPMTAYDVENVSLNVLLSNMGNDLFAEIKKFIYYSPDKIKVHNPETNAEEEVSPSIMVLAKLMSIYLRDKYLELHPEIK